MPVAESDADPDITRRIRIGRLAPYALPASSPAPAPAAAPSPGLPAAAPSAAPAAAPSAVPTTALPTALWLEASAGVVPPICTEAYWRQLASSSWKAAKLLSLPGSAMALGPVGGATAQPLNAKPLSRAIEETTRRIGVFLCLGARVAGAPPIYVRAAQFLPGRQGKTASPPHKSHKRRLS